MPTPYTTFSRFLLQQTSLHGAWNLTDISAPPTPLRSSAGGFCSTRYPSRAEAILVSSETLPLCLVPPTRASLLVCSLFIDVVVITTRRAIGKRCQMHVRMSTLSGLSDDVLMASLMMCRRRRHTTLLLDDIAVVSDDEPVRAGPVRHHPTHRQQCRAQPLHPRRSRVPDRPRPGLEWEDLVCVCV